ncbi:hypothetical protein WPS_12500 [Vulcanimicrobium alpinum]|uniref:EthD domain-containing protein n=1 Tax=Vulcanimicrobium alpinum TaxID=3016050 RepID=A0AAN1XV56_UNVUL|nr:EthD family reductase [Vulcanimicrobium alpinum]BDE05974.1 hypothetical protein WPS_12500 [Vulcanimicrobium alpinum]
MTKRIITVVRRADVSPEEFRHIYLEHHAPIVARMPGLLRYKQNAVLAEVGHPDAEVSGIAEVWYADDAAFADAVEERVALAGEAA